MSQLYATQTSQSNKKYPRLRVTLIGKPTFTRSLDYVSIRVSVSLFDVGPPFAELPNWRASLANQIRVFVLAICRVSRCALIKRAARRSGKNTCLRVTTFMSRDYRPLEVVRRIRKKKEKNGLREEKEGLIFGLWRRIRSSTKSRVAKTRFVVRCEG